ncbi:hypothetical protein ACWDSF_32355 [Nocardia beijingensis]
MSVAYAGEGKTDAEDAFLIAETARILRDLTVVDLTRSLGLEIGHRSDLRAVPGAGHPAAATGLVPVLNVPAAEAATCTVVACHSPRDQQHRHRAART